MFGPIKYWDGRNVFVDPIVSWSQCYKKTLKTHTAVQLFLPVLQWYYNKLETFVRSLYNNNSKRATMLICCEISQHNVSRCLWTGLNFLTNIYLPKLLALISYQVKAPPIFIRVNTYT